MSNLILPPTNRIIGPPMSNMPMIQQTRPLSLGNGITSNVITVNGGGLNYFAQK